MTWAELVRSGAAMEDDLGVPCLAVSLRVLRTVLVGLVFSGVEKRLVKIELRGSHWVYRNKMLLGAGQIEGVNSTNPSKTGSHRIPVWRHDVSNSIL